MPQDMHCIIGAAGQLGTELAVALHHAGERVLLLDIQAPTYPALLELPFETVDVRDQAALSAVFGAYNVTHVYHLAAA